MESRYCLLEDGRRIDLRHDLRGLAECHARDLGQDGRDRSAQITLGRCAGRCSLARTRPGMFLTVAGVRQGDLLAVRQNSRLLQDQLQRGAATGSAPTRRPWPRWSASTCFA